MIPTRILIVEDEPVIALDIEESLMSLGYEVTAVADCAEAALAAAAQIQPDLVLMDIHLRGQQNGIETATQLRQRYYLPIVFLTAHADESTLAQVKRTQPFGYIVKPFEIHDLSVAIEVALSRYQSEQAIQAMLQKERELTELKSRFVSIVSHEFRNPLSSVLLSLELMEHPHLQTDPGRHQIYLKRAKSATHRMIQLLEDVVTLNEVDAHNFDYQPAPILIIDFCQELVEHLQLHPDSSHTIRFTASGFTEANPLRRLDERLLYHALINLLSNAIKYSPSGSEIKFDLINEDTQLIFSIQDQGIGISPSEQSKVFDSFHRGANVGNIPGTGLGLSIVQQCVDAHRGKIKVESQINQGTIFTVIIDCDSEVLNQC